jgi:hypothetical protein
METKRQYIQRLVNYGLSLAQATQAANDAFSESSEPKSGQINFKQKLIQRIRGKFPALSPDQLKTIVDRAIAEQEEEPMPLLQQLHTR